MVFSRNWDFNIYRPALRQNECDLRVTRAQRILVSAAAFAQFKPQPGFCQPPIMPYGRRRNPQQVGGFFNAQSAEIPQFYDPAFTLVLPGQCFERFIQFDQARLAWMAQPE